MAGTIALTGATGYVGGRLLNHLLEEGHDVRCLVRRPERAQLPEGAEVVKGDVVTGAGLPELLAGAQVAYYLVHSMGHAADFAEEDRKAARTFGAAVRDAGVGRIVYLGGLEDGDAGSEHLRSRHEVASVLREAAGPDVDVVYARAAMVIGEGSASFIILRHLVERLPLMLTPRWVGTRSQPIAIHDVVRALAALGLRDEPVEEAQLGGADVLTYEEMMHRYAHAVERRPPRIIGVPVLTPRLSSYWVSLFTPVSAGLVRPLVDGLSAEMLVKTPPPPGVNDRPLGFEDAVRRARQTA